MSAEDIVILKKGGIDSATIQVIIQEKAIDTCAFTIQDILDLKKAGMDNQSIQQVIYSASFMKDDKVIEYGKEIRPIKLTSVKDILDLKAAGVSDEIILAIISGTKDGNEKDIKKAWEMLENNRLIIDAR